MKRIALFFVAGGVVLLGGLAGCDKGSSGSIDDCDALIERMNELDDGEGEEFKQQGKMKSMCKKADNLDDHEEAIKCLEEASNSKEAEKCDVEKMFKEWAMAAQKGG